MDKEEASIFRHVSITLMVTISLLTLVANGACIYIINKSKELSRTPSSYLIKNLLAVHLLQGIFVFPLYAAKKHGTESLLWNQIICDGFRFTFMLTFYLAVFSVLLISIDRFIAVYCVLSYGTMVSKRKVLVCIFAIWSYVTVLCLLPFKPIENAEIKGNISRAQNVTTMKHKCAYNQSKLWTTLMLGANCLFPYITIVITYQLITCRIRRIERKSKTTSTGNRVENTQQMKEISKTRRVTKVSMILSVAYLITWAPSIVYYMLWSVCPNTCFTHDYKHSSAESYVSFCAKYLAFLDAIASPVIYCLLSERFRHFVPCLGDYRKKYDGDNTGLLNKQHSNTSSDRMQNTLCIEEVASR